MSLHSPQGAFLCSSSTICKAPLPLCSAAAAAAKGEGKIHGGGGGAVELGAAAPVTPPRGGVEERELKLLLPKAAAE